MKRLVKFLVVSVIMTVLFAIPAFAQEITTEDNIIKEETFVSEMDGHEKEFANYEKWRADGYLEYLDGVIYNLNEVARIKKEIVTNYTELAKVNPYYATLIPAAQRDYEQAVAMVDYYKLYKKNAQAEFAVKYPGSK